MKRSKNKEKILLLLSLFAVSIIITLIPSVQAYSYTDWRQRADAWNTMWRSGIAPPINLMLIDSIFLGTSAHDHVSANIDDGPGPFDPLRVQEFRVDTQVACFANCRMYGTIRAVIYKDNNGTWEIAEDEYRSIPYAQAVYNWVFLWGEGTFDFNYNDDIKVEITYDYTIQEYGVIGWIFIFPIYGWYDHTTVDAFHRYTIVDNGVHEFPNQAY